MKPEEISDSYITEYLVNHFNVCDDTWGDAASSPYEFLDGFRGNPFTGFSISDKSAYDMGVAEREFYER